MKIVKLISVFTVSLMLAAFAGDAAATHLSKKNTENRIKPAFKVYVEGDKVPQVANELPKPAKPAGPRSGEDVYNTYCTACHGTGVAGAPKLGDAADWSARLAEGGVEHLYEDAINGVGAMPARGTCADCSDDEIKKTVDYILANSK
ncbi:cytochrome c5 family protein [Kangiella sp. TOML190]|uniref:c-type cytochrome n=1 Tax=Kangiella sp. TOML190 TaxID=2931351 RepID=UPI002040AD75|nr:c-type cytochrome [Kangiella sp. TOML190]